MASAARGVGGVGRDQSGVVVAGHDRAEGGFDAVDAAEEERDELP